MTSERLSALARSRVVRVVVGVLLALGVLVQTVGIPGVQEMPPYRIDLDVYRTGGQVFLDGGDLYGELPVLAEGSHLPFTYPPLSAEIFSLLTVVPLAVGSLLVTLATVAALGFVVYLVLAAMCRRPRAELLWCTAAVTAVGLWFGPVRENIGFGQVNVFLMALVFVGCLRGRDRWWGGVPVGLAAAVKLTPAVFVLYFLLRRDWRGVAVSVASGLAFTALGHLLSPHDSVRYWTFALKDPARIGGLGFASNQSVNGVVHRLGFEGGSASVVWFAVSALVGLAVAYVAWRLIRGGLDAAAVTVIGLVALCCSPVSWGHHWVWSVPMVLLCVVWALRAGRDGSRAWWVLAAVGAVVFLSTPQWWFPHSDGREQGWGPVAHVVGDAYLLWAVAFLATIASRSHCLGPADFRGSASPDATPRRSRS